jgi:hypothetical protein
MSPYARLVSVRKILGILVALSVLFAPGVAGAAMASPHHDMQMMGAGHCQTPPASTGDHEKADKSCCIAMCMAVAIAPSAPFDLSMPRQQVAQFPAPVAYDSGPHEIATPPPRPA